MKEIMENLKKGFVFGGIDFEGRIEVIRVHKKKNKLKVRLTQLMVIKEFCEWEETWSLEDTIWEFKNGEYFERNYFFGYPKTQKQIMEDYITSEKEKLKEAVKPDKPWWKFW